MSLEFLLDTLRTPWAIMLVVLFFGGSIFVHELGHYLAARWRGLKIDRFSVGFGPPLLKSTDKHGVEWWLSAIPLGGYVKLPQLGEMGGVEGKGSESATALPPLSYADKMYVSVAGAVFNILFALILASILWALTEKTDYSRETTIVGYVSPSLTNLGESGDKAENLPPSPAAKAGIQPGDRIITIDGRKVQSWDDVRYAIITGTGRDSSNNPKLTMEIDRAGELVTLTVYPETSGPENSRLVGITSANNFVVSRTYPNSPAEKAGLKAGDEFVAIDGQPLYSIISYLEYLDKKAATPVTLTYKRGIELKTAELIPETVTITTDGKTQTNIGAQFERNTMIVRVNPVERLIEDVSNTFQVLWALINPGSNIGIGSLSGPIGIANILYQAAIYDLRWMLAITALININLAIMNLLPLPILDGGHMAFATLGKIMGRPVPMRFIEGSQKAFVMLFLGLFLFVGFKDILRVKDNMAEERQYQRIQSTAIEPVYGQNK